MAFSSGLRVPTMSTHYPAGRGGQEGKTEKERKIEAKATQAALLFALKKTGECGE